jgi:chromate reductase
MLKITILSIVINKTKGVFMTRIAVIVGSLREDSINKKLAKNIESLAPEGVEFTHVDINLPLFNQDFSEDNYPVEARAAKDMVEAADGVLFVTPEYNRSLPGPLKNAIDWLSRPWGTNSFDGKPSGVIGASIGPVGTAVAQADLRHILGFLNAPQLGQPEIYVANASDLFDETGTLIDERWHKNLKAYIETFAAWVEKQK